MKLILTQEVDGLGAPGDVVEVKDGYGRNYLIPRGLGIRWTRGGEKTIESIKSARTARAVRAVASSAPSPPPRSLTPSPRFRARRSTAAPSWWSTRSRPSVLTRCRSSCTTRCPPRWPSTSSQPDHQLIQRIGPLPLRGWRAVVVGAIAPQYIAHCQYTRRSYNETGKDWSSFAHSEPLPSLLRWSTTGGM